MLSHLFKLACGSLGRPCFPQRGCIWSPWLPFPKAGEMCCGLSDGVPPPPTQTCRFGSLSPSSEQSCCPLPQTKVENIKQTPILLRRLFLYCHFFNFTFSFSSLFSSVKHHLWIILYVLSVLLSLLLMLLFLAFALLLSFLCVDILQSSQSKPGPCLCWANALTLCCMPQSFIGLHEKGKRGRNSSNNTIVSQGSSFLFSGGDGWQAWHLSDKEKALLEPFLQRAEMKANSGREMSFSTL